MNGAHRWAVIEKIVSLICIVATIVGVYAFGGGGRGLLALIMLSNMNSYTVKQKDR
jgi:hypothetical protein